MLDNYVIAAALLSVEEDQKVWHAGWWVSRWGFTELRGEKLNER